MNRDGDFIRYVKNEFRESTTEATYFYLVSDGQPGADNYTGKQGLDDTLLAIREAVNAGIRLVYFNVDLARALRQPSAGRPVTPNRKPEDLLGAIPREPLLEPSWVAGKEQTAGHKCSSVGTSLGRPQRSARSRAPRNIPEPAFARGNAGMGWQIWPHRMAAHRQSLNRMNSPLLELRDA